MAAKLEAFKKPLNCLKTMLALVASPTFKPAFDFEFLREFRATEAEKVARLVANLHKMLVNPNAAPGAAAAAKRMLLAVLQQTKDMRLPFMIVPPLAERRVRPASVLHAEPVEAESVCETCKRPVALPPARIVMPYPKRARASSSPRFRAKLSQNRGAHRSSRNFATSVTESRSADLREPAEIL